MAKENKKPARSRKTSKPASVKKLSEQMVLEGFKRVVTEKDEEIRCVTEERDTWIELAQEMQVQNGILDAKVKKMMQFLTAAGFIIGVMTGVIIFSI